MDNNQNQNSPLDKEQLLLKQMFLLPSDTDAYNDGKRQTNFARRLTVRPNLLSVYAVVVTLLLLLSANNSTANNNQVAPVAAETDDSRLALLELKLEQSQMRMLSLESKLVAAVDQAIAAEAPPAEKTMVEINALQVEVKPEIAVNELPILPVPLPPPLSFLQSSPPPLPIPQPVNPSSQSSALIPLPPVQLEIKPQPSTETATIDEIERKSDAKSQWLGQTNTVYFSSTFEEDQQSQHIADLSVGNSEQTQENSVAVMPSEIAAEPILTTEQKQLANQTEVVNLALLADLESKSNSETQANSLFDDDELAHYLNSSPSLDNHILPKKSATATVAQASTNTKNPLSDEISQELLAKKREIEEAKSGNNSVANSNPLFSDEDLAHLFSFGSLLDDDIIQEKLGNSATVAQLESQDAVHSTDSKSLAAEKTEKLEAVNLDLLAKLDDSTFELQQQELFSDEDLARHLSSTPLLDDEVIAHRLNTPAQLAYREANDSVKDEVNSSVSSKPSLPIKKANVINLSLLSKIEHQSNPEQKASTDEDLMQHMTLLP